MLLTDNTKLQENQDRNEAYGNQCSHILKLAPSKVPSTPGERTMVYQVALGREILSLQYSKRTSLTMESGLCGMLPSTEGKQWLTRLQSCLWFLHTHVLF